MRQLSSQAKRLLQHVRNRYPEAMSVHGLAEQGAVRELVEHNLVIEIVNGASTGYAATITATPWERRS